MFLYFNQELVTNVKEKAMKKLKLLTSIAVASLALYTLPAYSLEGGYSGEKSQFVPGEIIVKMKPTMKLDAANASALGVESEDKLTSGGEIIYHIQPSVMGTLSATQIEDRTLQAVKEFKKLPNVEYAQPNYILHIMKTPNDALYSKQWHYFNYGTGADESLGGIDLPKAWDISTGGNVVVAVIDTGILPNHEDIAGSPNLIAGYDMISDVKTANDGDGRDSDATDTGDALKKGECSFGSPAKDTVSSWHGTHVAGTIGVGKTNNNTGVAGINWNVKLQAVRVLGKCGGTTSDINDAIRWAAGLDVPSVPKNMTPAKVINMSLGGGQACSQSLATQQAINDAVNAGVTVVVAAGNDGKDASGYTPASCNNVITVAAADPQGKLTPYSNWGNTVEIMAPGGWTESGCPKPAAGVLSMVQTSSDRGNCGVAPAYAYYNGTSMATPHVAGVAALWLAQDPSLTPATLLTELKKAARPRSSTECSKLCGVGLLSALRKTGVDVSLVFDPDKSAYQPSETTKARVSVTMNGAPQVGKTVQFSSDNSSVASISPSSAVTNAQGQAEATVKANSQGQVLITAEAEGKKVQKSFKVQPAAKIDIGLAFDPDKSSYQPSETTKASASVTMNGAPQAGKTVQFSSSNPSVASVSSASATTNNQGLAETTVKVSGEGQAVITAEAEGVKAQKTVNVPKVPDLSWSGFMMLLVSIIGIGLFRRKPLSV
jgi:serine protease